MVKGIPMNRREKLFRITRTRVLIDFVDVKARSKRSALADAKTRLGEGDVVTVADLRYEVDEFGRKKV